VAKQRKVPPGYRLIFRRYRRVRGRKKLLDARDYGYAAWPILIPVK